MRSDLQRYLAASAYIDWTQPSVVSQARALADGLVGDEAIARRCFEFVRDAIAHSWDARRGPVTCKASAVLAHQTGYCYAKSHLLAALLRANAIPAGLCYQRLAVGAEGPPFCLHGLNAVYLERHGWYRIDARGNREGVCARFSPPEESLAFPIAVAGERDLPSIWVEPHALVIETLSTYHTVEQVQEHLPDVDV